jgi:DNA-binding transcriptional MocR family regulator
MWKPKIINTDNFLYLAVADALEDDIRKGVLKPGEKLPAHRELADIIGINVSTATRAYQEAERRGLITGTTGRGTYVSSAFRTDPNILDIDTNTPAYIDLGPVYPLYSQETELFELMEKLNCKGKLNEFAKYSNPQGHPQHREAGAKWMMSYGINVSPEDIIICAGTQHALTCCFVSLFQPGDSIGVDKLTYSGLKALVKALKIKLVPIDFDGEGMDPENLESACHREQLKGIYIMSGTQNPTTIAMTRGRKKELAEVALRNQLIVIEDNTYGFTLESQLLSMYSLIPEQCIHIEGLSKAFFAGLRTAFVVAAKPFKSRMIKAVLNTIWMAPTLNSAIVAEAILGGYAEKIVASKLVEAKKRYQIAQKHLKDYNFHGFPNTYFIWLELPDHWNAYEFEIYARKAGINLFSAEKFIVGSTLPPKAVRISLSGVDSRETLAEGLKGVAALLKDEPVEFHSVL